VSDKKQVLIVEDQEATRLFLSQILEDHGYGYQVARNGDEAISALRRERPDLVLLDIMMPRKSGIHVFHAVKNDSRLADIPVIVVTGISQVTGVDLQTGEEAPTEDEGDVCARGIGSVLREKLQGLRPDGLIEKPVTPSTLVAKIQDLLPRP
jgi:twitching motility two-component system response regulator PilH